MPNEMMTDAKVLVGDNFYQQPRYSPPEYRPSNCDKNKHSLYIKKSFIDCSVPPEVL